MVARDRARGMRSYYFIGTELQFCKMKSVLHMVGGNDSKQYEYTSCRPTLHLNVIKTADFMLHVCYHDLFFKKDLFIYLFMGDAQREAETQAEGKAGSTQGARRGTRSRVSRITLWAKGSTKLLSHPGCPLFLFLV